MAGSGTPSTTITGTPTVPGRKVFTVKLTDSLSNVTTGTLAITIVPDIAISGTLPNGQTFIPYGNGVNNVLTVAGGTPPYTWAVINCLGSACIGGQIPGLALTNIGPSSAQYAGTPIRVGIYSITVQATDAHGYTGRKLYSIRITSGTVASGHVHVGDTTNGMVVK
jgi:hypothetical protein